jgi:ribosomal protein S1
MGSSLCGSGQVGLTLLFLLAQPGQILEGEVKRFVKSGALVALPGGHEGLLRINHVSQVGVTLTQAA